jgi:hypothetical protein
MHQAIAIRDQALGWNGVPEENVVLFDGGEL